MIYKGLKDAEYRAMPELSQSQLKTFHKDPRAYFKKYVQQEVVEEDKDSAQESDALRFGAIVDCILTSEAEFDDRFIITEASKPTAKMGEFVDALYRHTMANQNEEGRLMVEMEELYELSWKEVGYKITLEKVKENFAKEGLAYYTELRSRGQKVVTTREEWEKAQWLASKLREHPYSAKLINLQDSDRFKIHRQLVLTGEIDGVEMKGMLDFGIEDLQEGVFYPWDLKITSGFPYSYLKYLWYLQLGNYTLLSKINFPDYSVKPLSYITCDRTMYGDPLKWIGTEESYQQALHGFKRDGKKYSGFYEILDDWKYCRQHNCYTSGRLAHMNGGRLEIELFEPLGEYKRA